MRIIDKHANDKFCALGAIENVSGTINAVIFAKELLAKEITEGLLRDCDLPDHFIHKWNDSHDMTSCKISKVMRQVASSV